MLSIKTIIKIPSPPTDEEIKNFKLKAAKELEKLDDFDDSKIIYDEDSPRLSEKRLEKMKRAYWREEIKNFASGV